MTGPLDPAGDPDRYDAGKDVGGTAGIGPLDPASDPDRFRAGGEGRTLPEMLGEGSHEDTRDNWQWLIGLLSVLAFLAVVSLLVTLF